MSEPINWVDSYMVSKDRIIYTEEQMKIPGIRIFAKHNNIDSIPSLTWHYHKNAFEFTYIVHGNITFATQFTDYKVSGSDIFLAFPDEIHSTRDIPISICDMYWFQLDISDPNNFLFLDTQTAHHLIDRLMQIRHHVIQTDPQILYPLIRKAFSIAITQKDPQWGAGYLTLILQHILENSEKEQFHLSPDIGQSMNYILDHLGDELPHEILAKQANLSNTRYNQKFKQQVGISPKHFVNQQKIEYSKTLLLDGISITDIAMQLSFSTSSYFTSVFKKYTLYTPSDYIKLHTIIK